MKKIIKIASAIALSGTFLYGGGYIAKPTMGKDSKVYLGIGFGAASVNSYIYDKETVADMVFKVGYDVSNYLGIEFRASAGVNEGDFLGHGYSYGIYLKPQYPIGEKINIFALIGYAKTEITLDEKVAIERGVSSHTTQDGFSYGAGIDYRINKKWSVSVDATRLIDESTVLFGNKYATKVDTVTFGATYHF